MDSAAEGDFPFIGIPFQIISDNGHGNVNIQNVLPDFPIFPLRCARLTICQAQSESWACTSPLI
jgi:hypothetical protein